MNWDIIQGKWQQFKGSVKEKWGDLTDDEIDQIDGNRDQLSGKLQEKYGWAKDDAERRIDDFIRDKS
ncbi:CsbD family protein [Paracoccus onubensis]|uniref:CsbD family protein n=1 Tax=Paracoccus onubensis TaxID=1675788 RepID=UPI0027300803|nr:CsbD family protein [Paracoccus onubensis]MDP0926298.1 CsbD family protein [Paracoccus onubensis]